MSFVSHDFVRHPTKVNKLYNLDSSRLRLKLSETGMLKKELAGKLTVSTRTVTRILKDEKCSLEHLTKLAEIFGVDANFFYADQFQSSCLEQFVGQWLSYFVEFDAVNFVVVEEEIDVSSNGTAYSAKTVASTVENEREDKISWLKEEQEYLLGETYVANWVQPLGRALFILKMLPNADVLEGELIFVDDTRGRVIATKHMWIRKTCTDEYLVKFVANEMEAERAKKETEASSP